MGELIDLIGTIGLGDKDSRSKDILGRVYEYSVRQRRGKEGRQLYTPRCVVRLLVEMIEPFKGRVYDSCCGSSDRRALISGEELREFVQEVRRLPWGSRSAGDR